MYRTCRNYKFNEFSLISKFEVNRNFDNHIDVTKKFVMYVIYYVLLRFKLHYITFIFVTDAQSLISIKDVQNEIST